MRLFLSVLATVLVQSAWVEANECSQLAQGFASKNRSDHSYIQDARALAHCLNSKVIPASQAGGTMGNDGGLERPGSMYSKFPCDDNGPIRINVPPALYECSANGRCSPGLALDFNDKTYNFMKNSMIKSGLVMKGNEDIILVPKSTFTSLSSVISKTPVRTLSETKKLLQPIKN